MKRVLLGSLALAGVMSAPLAGEVLSPQEKAMVCIGAATARGGQDALEASFRQGFQAGLTLNEAKELVGQLYAYCGFPRALNAASALMKVTEERTRAGNPPAEGPVNGPMPAGSPLAFGTENQTKLCGGPVAGPLFQFHPQLDEYLKAHLFGDIFARDSLSWRTRELATIAALAARPETAPQLRSHIEVGKKNGLDDGQVEAILRLVRCPEDPALLPPDWSPFPVGEPNVAYARYFLGRSFLAPVSGKQVPMASVTFAPGCRNNWHIHHASQGGGQILVATAGEGWYQEWGAPARRLRPGDTVNIPAGVKHWHGAGPDGWFQHLAVEVPGAEGRTEWLEAVDDAAYAQATRE
ncbi:MAG: carboxymuconolactone decarboxylase family protein [Oligosphaeraceae bacterium]